VTENYDGIFYVEGSAPPVQIVVGKKLSRDDGMLLKALAYDLDTQSVADIVNAQETRLKGVRLDAYIHVLMRTNPIAVEEAMKMQKVKSTTNTDVMIRTGLAEETRKASRLEGKREDRLEIAGAMFTEGDSIEKIARITKLPIDTLEKHLKASNS
jgi:predicted transposase YdaD